MNAPTFLQLLHLADERQLLLDAMSELDRPKFTLNNCNVASIRPARTAGLSASFRFGVVIFCCNVNGEVFPTLSLNDVIVLTRLRQTCRQLRTLIPQQTLDRSGYNSILARLAVVPDSEYFANFAGEGDALYHHRHVTVRKWFTAQAIDAMERRTILHQQSLYDLSQLADVEIRLCDKGKVHKHGAQLVWSQVTTDKNSETTIAARSVLRLHLLPTTRHIGDLDAVNSAIVTAINSLHILEAVAFRQAASPRIAMDQLVGYTHNSVIVCDNFNRNVRSDVVPPWPPSSLDVGDTCAPTSLITSISLQAVLDAYDDCGTWRSRVLVLVRAHVSYVDACQPAPGIDQRVACTLPLCGYNKCDSANSNATSLSWVAREDTDRLKHIILAGVKTSENSPDVQMATLPSSTSPLKWADTQKNAHHFLHRFTNGLDNAMSQARRTTPTVQRRQHILECQAGQADALEMIPIPAILVQTPFNGDANGKIAIHRLGNYYDRMTDDDLCQAATYQNMQTVQINLACQNFLSDCVSEYSR